MISSIQKTCTRRLLPKRTPRKPEIQIHKPVENPIAIPEATTNSNVETMAVDWGKCLWTTVGVRSGQD
jgi:hypothetical protein